MVSYTNGAFIGAAETLLICLGIATADISAPPAGLSLRSGAAIALDISQDQNECCGGLAWVRVGDEYPSTQFPSEDGDIGGCGVASWAVELEMGVARCAPVGDINNTPTYDEHYALARVLEEDSAALRRTICCFVNQWRAKGWRVSVGRLSKFGPEGGCVGTIVTLTAQVFPVDTWS